MNGDVVDAHGPFGSIHHRVGRCLGLFEDKDWGILLKFVFIHSDAIGDAWVLLGPKNIVDTKHRKSGLSRSSEHLTGDSQRFKNATFNHVAWLFSHNIKADMVGVITLMGTLLGNHLKQCIKWVEASIFG
ncbi:hypothetical protein OAH50_01125, partial [bacterium]|nr:hypothetical protein [bacterium]